MLIAFVCPVKAVKNKISVWREKMCSFILHSPGNVLEKNTGEPNIYFFHFRPKILPHLSGFSGSFYCNFSRFLSKTCLCRSFILFLWHVRHPDRTIEQNLKKCGNPRLPTTDLRGLTSPTLLFSNPTETFHASGFILPLILKDLIN